MRKRSEAASRATASSTIIPIFSSADEVADVDPAFAKIVHTVLQSNVMHEYDRLERSLVIGEHRGDYATVLKHVDAAEDNARVAHKLYLAARIERERYEAASAKTIAAMWRQAKQSLEEIKRSGDLKKQITDADVERQCIFLFGDEWDRIQEGKLRVKLAESHMEHLSDLWKSRCNTLRTIIAVMRKLWPFHLGLGCARRFAAAPLWLT